MSFRASEPAAYAGQVIGNGHCVAYVHLTAGTPHTSRWRRGEWVRGAETVREGTVIATFGPDGEYTNRTDGSSHAAVLVLRQDNGLQVWDQWVGRPVDLRVIRYKNGTGPACDDGDRFFVVEAAAA